MSLERRFPSTVEFLYGTYRDHARGSRIVPHSHPDYWQLEICIDGALTLVLSDNRIRMTPGQGVFLPPGLLHDFDYRESESFGSVKFQPGVPAGALPFSLIPESPRASCFLGNIVVQLQNPGIVSEELLAFFVADLFEFHYRNLENGEPPVIRMLQGLAAARQPLSPAAAARLCGYSRDYLNRQVHKRFGVSLKSWLDRELAGRARRSLDYSSQGVTEIAAELGFPSVYAFSRFFSRVTGMSPTAYRKRHGEAGDALFLP